MIAMAERPREGPNPAALLDEFSVFHTHDVHALRTHVNVESVASLSDNAYVSNDESTGQALSRLRAQAGMTVRDLAVAAGYSHGSGIQRYIDDGFDKNLAYAVAERFADALAGKGSPPIAREEVLALSGVPVEPNAAPFKMEGAGAERMKRDVPIYGTALGAVEVVDGEAIEQTMLNTAETIGYLRRPVILDGRADVYGLYVQGSSMDPRYRDGATVFVETRKPPRIGDDVVVYLRQPDEHDGERVSCALIKTLARKTAHYVELEQYGPALTFKLPIERIDHMDRVIPFDELVA